MHTKETQTGFTFVELIVSLGILLLLVALIIFVLNPLKQINKAFDGRRVADLSSFTSVFETYYNDNQHFPTSIPFGTIWKQGNTVYMSTTPQDPQRANTNGGYLYMTDGSSSPQWGVIFSKLSTSSSNASCELTPDCAPAGYVATAWACKVFGTVNCQSLASQSLPGTTIVSQGTQSNGISNTFSTTQSSSSNSMTQVTLCHYNSSNNYTQETTGATSDVGGHDGHANDIIPPFTYSCTTGTCQYSGKNWTAPNQATYNNKCIVVPPSSQCTTNGISGLGMVVTSQGSDGSTCQEESVGDMYHPGYCSDSTGYDSRVSGNNACTTSSPLGISVTRYNCAITNGGTGVGCATSSTPYYPCSSYGSGCMSGECIPTQPTNSYPPDIRVSTQDGTTQVTPDIQTYFTVQVNKTCSHIVWSQLYVDGIDFPCTQQDINKVNWVCQGKVISSLVPNAQKIHVQAFTLDYSGNSGYAEMYVHFP